LACRTAKDAAAGQKDSGSADYFFAPHSQAAWDNARCCGTMTLHKGGETPPNGDLLDVLLETRGKLHRYCSRMTGSVMDGEDIVQEAMLKALVNLTSAEHIRDPEAWLFRIAHNTALDFLRARNRLAANLTSSNVELSVDPLDGFEAREIAAQSLRTFMRLPVPQRSAVILKDVLGYSHSEIVQILEGSTIQSTKALLHRGRGRLRELSQQQDVCVSMPLSKEEGRLLEMYVERFNNRDFESI
jgi:RNA polymerase sigma-70 factor, ECF subfamily